MTPPAQGRLIWLNLSPFPTHNEDGGQLVKPNYAFAKRQRDVAKKQKKEEKRKRKLGADEVAPAEGAPPPPTDEKTSP
jgi:hypothetical protein